MGEYQAMSTHFQTHMFWAYGNFSNVEKISASSFLKNGYRLNIWTYGDISNAPPGATVRDAREVLPEALFFQLPSGSCAPFSDLFRYAVLNTIGGLWADTDVVALKPAEFSEPFLVTQRTQRGLKRVVKDIIGRKPSLGIVGNVIFNPTPLRGNMIDLAYHYSERFPKEKVQWAELGPDLLSFMARLYTNHGYSIKPPEFANSIDFWICARTLLQPGGTVHHDATFLHLYNETWRAAKIDKNAAFPKGSIMSRFSEQYL